MLDGVKGWSMPFFFIATKWSVTDVSMTSAALMPASNSCTARLKTRVDASRTMLTLMPSASPAFFAIVLAVPVVGRAGDDEVAGDQLLVAHRPERAWSRLQRELRARARAHAHRREELHRPAQRGSHAPDEVTPGLECLRLRVGGDGADQEAELVGRHLAAHLGGALPVIVEELAGDVEGHQEGHEGVTAPAGPDRRLRAGRAGNPDRRMRFLERQAPRVHVT